LIVVRRAEERGRFDFGWLDTRHTFSFDASHVRLLATTPAEALVFDLG
jgi:hypothetical protein